MALPSIRPLAFALALCAPLAGGAAWGAEWQVDAGASSLVIDYTVNGVESEARFTRFEGEGVFDPTAPDQAELVLDFEMKALDFGSPVATAFALGPDWFASTAHPDGRFRLTGLRGETGGGFVADGLLTLKGVTRPLTVPISLTLDGPLARAVGRLAIEPLAFGIGKGPTAFLVSMGRQAVIRFDLVARAAEAPR